MKKFEKKFACRELNLVLVYLTTRKYIRVKVLNYKYS